MNAHGDLYTTPYRAYHNNHRVIKTLTPLVTLLLKIDKLVKPTNSLFTNVKDVDVADVFANSPDIFIRYIAQLAYTIKNKRKNNQMLHSAIQDLQNQYVWLPVSDDEKTFDVWLDAVERAMISANIIITQMEMVQLDRDSAQCIYLHDGTQYEKAQVGPYYDLSVLYCLTPRGIVNDFINVGDCSINEGILRLNPTNVKQISFHLTEESRDHPRVTFAFPNYKHTIAFSDVGTEPLHVYVPQNQQNVVIPITYHTDYVDVSLSRVAVSQLPNTIDPNDMIVQFARDFRNVHLHANLQLPHCQLVSARVNFAHLTEPICLFLDYLFQTTESLPDGMPEKYAIKVPYIYSIDMRTLTCTRRQMLKHDIAIPLMTPEAFAPYKAIEYHLIRYTIFQMMLIYRKFTYAEFQTCPEHHMTFDLYCRRGAWEIGFHYDLTPGNIVADVGLLYSMPRGHVKVGPQLIPRKYRTDGIISDTNVIPMSAFVQRNSVVLFNNATCSHSTPNVENFISRIPYKVGYEVRDQHHATIHYATLDVTHDPIKFPASIREKLRESSVNPSRTFLRSWHIVHISQAQLEFIAQPEHVVFSNGMTFQTIAEYTMRECVEWLRTEGCMCVEVATDDATGEIVLPSKLPGYLRGGRIPTTAVVPNPQQLKVQLNPQQLKPSRSKRSKTQYSHRSKITSPLRAYTLSITHLKQQISSKVKKIRAVLNNPKKNLIVMSGPMITQRRRAHSHSQKSPNKRNYTRKVRSAP